MKGLLQERSGGTLCVQCGVNTDFCAAIHAAEAIEDLTDVITDGRDA